MKVTVLIDSSGWIEYFGDGPKAKKFALYIENATESNTIVPTIVIFEVFKKIKKEFGEQQAMEKIAYIFESTKTIDLDKTTAIEAAATSLQTGLAMADAIIKTTADLNKAKIITSDEHFKNLPNTEII